MAKSDYAKYTFAFAGDVQKLADEKHIKVLSFNTKQRKSAKGSYDVLEVYFLVPRPDRDYVADERALDNTINELETGLEKENEVNKDEI